MQLGYLLDKKNQKREAYDQFAIAADYGDAPTKQEANRAMDYLRPWHTKLLPAPYFGEVFLSPYHSSRFHDWIIPVNARAGCVFGDKGQFELYFGLRANRDTKSKSGAIPIILSDNVGILSAGARVRPLAALPLSLYAEYGAAYDLLDRNRNRSRSDTRAGILLWQDWIQPSPLYGPSLQFPFRLLGDVYGDASYYSRYDANIITYLRLREGLRVAQKGHGALDVLGQAWGVVDRNKDFFNNIIEVGPVVQFTPDVRYGLVLRFMSMYGTYIRRAVASFNPYNVHYTDNRCELDYFWRF